MKRFLILVALVLSYSCNSGKARIINAFHQGDRLVNPAGITVKDRFRIPEGYRRLPVDVESFAAYLRALPLKPDGAQVKYYNGAGKPNFGIYAAVVDLKIGNLNLQQCADAVIHLRADYFYKRHQYNKIHFNFTNGFRADFLKWMEGYRIKVTGNNVSWVKTNNPSVTIQTFNAYLNQVYTYAGTLSLSKELKKVEYNDMQVGDVLIRGGSPGHAVIVVDMAVNDKGKKIFLLAQSYMPAQEIQILENPVDRQISPWYVLDDSSTAIITPQWNFTTSELKRFED